MAKKQSQLTVDDRVFVGRVEEQKQFRAALAETLNPPAGENLPYVFLLYGDGGIGKTTLAKRFRDIALQEAPFKDKVQMLWIDWEDERKKFPELQVGREQIQAEDVF
ncbi:MAG: ATP-binding protein, partial [Anaerolineales bacterium]|nr:ATP-binding protein [Anaerolineales bacterium]